MQKRCRVLLELVILEGAEPRVDLSNRNTSKAESERNGLEKLLPKS